VAEGEAVALFFLKRKIEKREQVNVPSLRFVGLHIPEK
jgi:hypothetical protein